MYQLSVRRLSQDFCITMHSLRSTAQPLSFLNLVVFILGIVSQGRKNIYHPTSIFDSHVHLGVEWWQHRFSMQQVSLRSPLSFFLPLQPAKILLMNKVFVLNLYCIFDFVISINQVIYGKYIGKWGSIIGLNVVASINALILCWMLSHRNCAKRGLD